MHPHLKTIAPATRAAIRKALGTWYEKVQRELPWRRTRDPYAIWVSEVMLQQTQVKTAMPYYLRFLERFPTVEHLAGADLQEVFKLWEGLGYYARARNLHLAAQKVARTMDGRLPDRWEAIRALPGVGDYIAAAVLSIAFDRPHAVVDGNVKRVLARLFTLETPVNGSTGHKVFQVVADQLLDARNPGRHNQAIMELGAEVCVPRRPGCEKCPLTRFCQALQTRATGQYPRRNASRAVGRQQWVAGVIIKQGRLLLTQRPGQGLLAGLWELPGGSVREGQSPIQACIERIRETIGLSVAVDRHITTVDHAYTHFKLKLDVYFCTIMSGRVRRNGPADHHWVPMRHLNRFPLHKAVHKALPALVKFLADGTLRFGHND